MKLYISGGMTGYKDFNFPKFNEVTQKLRKQGYEVINPVELVNPPYDKEWSEYMRIDIHELSKVDGIVVLEGWNKSKGATIEVYIGIILNMQFYTEDMTPIVDVKKYVDQSILLQFIR